MLERVERESRESVRVRNSVCCHGLDRIRFGIYYKGSITYRQNPQSAVVTMALVTAYCRGYGAIRRGFHPYASSLDEAPYLWRVRKRKREDGIGFSAHTVRVVVKGICVTPSRPCCAVQTPFKLSQAVSKKINVSSRAFTSKDRDLHPFPLFDDMEDLDETLKAALKRQQLDQMTEVQALTWDAAMDDKDVVARSRTGSGKTIAFLLPGIQQIINEQQQHSGPAVESPNNGVRMLILSPTRELARQIHRQSQLLTSLLHDGQGTRTECNCQVVYGGTSKQLEIESMIQQIPHVLSATPGRLLDHIGSSYVANQPFRNLLSNTKLLVLDEADRMLDMGFRDDIRNIISFLPHTSERQTMLFSATMPTQVREMVDLCIRRDLDQRTFIDCTSGDRPTLMEKSHINHTHVLLPRDRIVSGVVQVILHMMKKRKKDYKIIVFCPTTSQVKFFSRLFNQGLGRQVLDIHSGKGQVARTVVSDRFRHGEYHHPYQCILPNQMTHGHDFYHNTQRNGPSCFPRTYLRVGLTILM